MSFNKIASFSFFVLVLSLVWLWFNPYSVQQAQTLLPPPLPAISMGVQEGFLDQILDHNLWDENRGRLEHEENANTQESQAIEEGEEGLVGGQGVGSQRWKLVGVSQQGLISIAVVESAQGIKNYQVGDELPNGAKIDQIMPFGIQVSRRGENENIYLFGKQ